MATQLRAQEKAFKSPNGLLGGLHKWIAGDRLRVQEDSQASDQLRIECCCRKIVFLFLLVPFLLLLTPVTSYVQKDAGAQQRVLQDHA
jgi:hypothetical protein